LKKKPEKPGTLEYNIVLPDDNDWRAISDLIAASIPNTIISHLGHSFGIRFYKSIASTDYSCVFVCKDNLGNVNAVIIGTLSHSASYSKIRRNAFVLLLAANYHLLKWSVIRWIFLNLCSKLFQRKNNLSFPIEAELIVIAVSPDMRGEGISVKLIQCWEEFLIKNSKECEYYILTEKNNERANGFYKKIGAQLITTMVSRGRKINRWHKRLIPE